MQAGFSSGAVGMREGANAWPSAQDMDFTESSQQTYEVNALHLRLRIREGKLLTQGHTVNKGQC